MADDETTDIPPETIFITVSPDEETWLPQVNLGFPIGEGEDPEWVLGGATFASMQLTPETAYQVGAGLIQAAAACQSFYAELIDKTVEEREEIFVLEHALTHDPTLN